MIFMIAFSIGIELQEEVVTTKKSWTGIASKVPGLALVLSTCTRYRIPVVSKYFTI